MLVFQILFLILIFEVNTNDCVNKFQILEGDVEYTDNYIDITNYQAQEAYSYSFWIKYAILDPKYKNNQPNDGQNWCSGFYYIIWSQVIDYDFYKTSLLMLNIQRNICEFKFYYSEIDADQPTEVTIQQDAQKLDNQWIYFMISYYPNEKNVVIQKDSDITILNVQSIYQGNVQTTLGNDNFIVIANRFFWVKLIPGLLTNQIYYEKLKTQNDFYYSGFLNCKPQDDSQPITKIYVDGLQQFNSGLVIVDKFLRVGQKYMIHSWVKLNLDLVTITNPLSQLLMRITINSYYNDYKYEGDRTFYYRYNIYKQEIQNSNVYVETSHYKIPVQCYKFNEIYGEVEDFEKWQFEDVQLYNLIQNWHFFIFEHVGQESLEESSCFYLYFQFSLQPIKHCFGSANQRSQYSNGYYYVYIGQDDFINKKLVGSISDLTIKYNYNEIQEIKIICHFSCSTCDGPTANDCLSCDSQYNRIFDDINRSCVCLKNHMQIEKNKSCQSIQTIFPYSQENQISTINQEECDFGYFKIPKNNGFICKKCPFEIINHIHCLDCYEYPNHWYLNPICTTDFFQQDRTQDQGYIFYERSENEYEVFLLDIEDNLNYFQQYQYICSESDIRLGLRNCVQINIANLKQETFVECTSNYYYENGDCIQCQTNCLKCKSKNECDICIQQHYVKKGDCIQCPLNCNSCYYDELIQDVQCQSCILKFTLFKGICQQCGSYCQTCIEDFDINSQQYFNRCLQCIDSSKYYISITGGYCLENTIENCLYAYEYIQIDDIIINTLDYKFQTVSQHQPINSCARCKDKYGVNENNQCQDIDNFNFNNCIFSAYLDTTQSYVCIIGSESKQSNQCSLTSLYCQTCLYLKSVQKNFCITCLDGYYADRLTGLCFQCPKSLFCNTCYQQMKINQDYWQINIMNYYETIINKDGQHTFRNNAQSQNNQDYEVICSSCIDQYLLLNNQCIKLCPDDCAQCILQDNQFVCLKCIYESQGRMLTIFNNQCQRCSQNCKVCRNRSQNEITALNPFFQDETYIMYSRQCLIPSNQKVVYNKEFGIFQECNLQGYCENHMLFQINLYCDFEEYKNAEQLNQDNLQFLQGNMYLNDLFKNNFTIFSNNLLFQHGNEAQISTITFQINSKQPQNCFLDEDFIISQNLKQHIFTLKTVKIQIIGHSLLTFRLTNNLLFVNFEDILLQNIKFVIAPILNQQLQISTQSITYQNIKFFNLTFTTLVGTFGCSIQIYNAQQLLFQNIILQDYKQGGSNGFIDIYSSNLKGYTQIQDFHLINTDIQDSQFIQFQTSKNHIIELQNLFINSNLYRSQFIVCALASGCGEIKISNLESSQSLSMNSLMFSLEKFSETELINLNFNNIELMESTFIQFIQKFTLTNFTIRDSIIINSLLINNDLLTNLQKSIYTFSNLQFISNSYNKKSKFITIYRYAAQESIIIVQEASFLKNKLQDMITIENLKQFDQSLIVFQSDQIKLKDIIIHQGNGLPLISFINSYLIEINNLYITTSNQIKDLIQTQEISILQLGLILQFFANQNIEINNMIVESVLLSNYPLISYESITTSISEQNELVVIKNSSFFNNILVYDSTRNVVCLFQLVSEQNVTLRFENVNFQNNILYHKNQGQNQRSVTLLYQDCQACTYYFISNQFVSNIAINASVSIIYIRSKEVNILGSLFSQNGVYNTEINNQLKVLSVKINDKMINQRSANGIFYCSHLRIYDTSFEFSKGSLASGFQFLSSSIGNLDVKRTIFQHNQNLFFGDNSQGGSIYIEGNSNQYQINLENNIFKNISSGYGGALQIQNSLGRSLISMKNTQIEDVNSLYGTVVYAVFSYQVQSQSLISISDLKINNSFSSFAKFQKQILESISNQAIDKLFQYRSMFYSEYGKLSIFNMYILQSHQEIVIIDYFIKGLILKQVDIKNTNYSQYGLIFIYPNTVQKVEISIKELSISGSLISDLNIFSYDLILGLINILNLNEQHYVIMDDIQLQKINCSVCQKGLINIDGTITLPKQIMMRRINIQNNTCGLRGCVNIWTDNEILDDTKQINQSTKRQLQSKTLNLVFPYSIVIENYLCNGNIANFGVCLRNKDYSILLDSLQLLNNKATNQGGAIVFSGSKAIFKIINSIIANNVASVAGGIYYSESFSQNYSNLNSYIFNNSAIYYGNDTIELPNQIKITIHNHSYSNQQIFFKNEIVIDQVLISNQYQNNQSSVLLPSGQLIYLYQQFDWENNNYIMMNYTLRLIPYDQRNNRIKNLTSSKCSIKGRLYDYKKLEESEQKAFSNNFTNLNEVVYDNFMEEYNFDHLIIYFDPDLPENIVLQFEFTCDSIRIPILNEIQQIDTIIKQSKDYYLRLNIKTLPCQIGELKSEEDLSCHPCDYTQDYYSVNFNSNKCKIRDNIQMEQVKSAQIKLRPNYWRPYFYADLIEYCYNFEFNCLGGWNYGDVSCSLGHIGALCEQCDIYNIRGDGAYSISQKYKCGSCDDTKSNTLIIIGISLCQSIQIKINWNHDSSHKEQCCQFYQDSYQLFINYCIYKYFLIIITLKY
ncbi:unnamed protein product [Paramecium primaurelia]|uniref:Transmembrane protein n=1 Tax=Paramecium primaurelia TaxID=5886 RepID=A0A8S1NVW9_PARPR|nr:unnamed protein product [Paramecium primaurelia]